ncbi:MAG: DUF5818 domain-containing protein [Terracidiphilus sp.]
MKITFLQFIKRDLTLGLILSALVFVSALAFGGPFLSTSQQPTASTAATFLAQNATLQGTVMRDGSNVYLSLGTGNLYELQNVRHVRRFDGKLVRVTGQVDSRSKRIVVERMRP